MFAKKIKKNITIEGMMCDHCKNKVCNALSELPDVIKVKVDLKTKIAQVTSNTEISNDILKQKIEDLGYQVTNIS